MDVFTAKHARDSNVAKALLTEIIANRIPANLDRVHEEASAIQALARSIPGLIDVPHRSKDCRESHTPATAERIEHQMMTLHHHLL